MRDYAKISPKFWIGKTGKDLRKLGPQVQLLAIYLLSSPHSTMLGIYHLPIEYICADTGSPFEGACKGLRSLFEAGFCDYDEASEVVWVYEMARYQVGEGLSTKDNKAEGVRREYMSLPENAFLSAFYDKYKDDFHLELRRGFEGASKGLASKEKEKEKEKENEKEQEQDLGALPNASLFGDAPPPEKTALPAKQKKQPAKGQADPETQAACMEVWQAYKRGYQARYGTEPVRNAKINGQVKQYVSRVPRAEAPAIAEFFCAHGSAYYVRCGHAFGALLADAEKLRTEWATGNRITAHKAAEVDRLQSDGDGWAAIIKRVQDSENNLEAE